MGLWAGYVGYIGIALLCLHPAVSSATALIAGVVFSLSFGNPLASFTHRASPLLLQASVVGLGAGMNLAVIGKVGASGIGYTAVGIIATMGAGLFLGNVLKVKKETSLLLAAGTAICGGSAIAAVGSAIRAKPQEMSVSLVTVFVLNAVALCIFPPIGHYFALSETQFGLWGALAIHDTSSVVGAASAYGAQALEIATTVKLARALWIIPLSIVCGIAWSRKDGQAAATKKKWPWFILGFLAAAAIVTWIPETQSAGHVVSNGARRLLVLTLFVIGSGMTRATLKSVGARPFMQGITLWCFVTAGTLAAVLAGWIR